MCSRNPSQAVTHFPTFSAILSPLPERCDLDPHFPNRKLLQMCFAREADDLSTETRRTSAPDAPASPSIFPSFHQHKRTRLKLSHPFSNHFAAHSEHFKRHSQAIHSISNQNQSTIPLDPHTPFSKITQHQNRVASTVSRQTSNEQQPKQFYRPCCQEL